jgi:chaperonin GroES
VLNNYFINKGDMMNFQPLGDRVLVLREDQEQKTPSGIYIPDSAKEKSLEAIVKVVSSDVEDEGVVKVGDRVVLESNYSGTTISLSGQEYVVIETSDILGIIK